MTARAVAVPAWYGTTSGRYRACGSFRCPASLPGASPTFTDCRTAAQPRRAIAAIAILSQPLSQPPEPWQRLQIYANSVQLLLGTVGE